MLARFWASLSIARRLALAGLMGLLASTYRAAQELGYFPKDIYLFPILVLACVVLLILVIATSPTAVTWMDKVYSKFIQNNRPRGYVMTFLVFAAIGGTLGIVGLRLFELHKRHMAELAVKAKQAASQAIPASEDVRQTGPFIGKIDAVLAGNDSQRRVLMVLVQAINDGAVPSTLSDWKLYIRRPGVRDETELKPFRYEPNAIIQMPNLGFAVSSNDGIDDKTFPNAIAPGNSVRGWIFASVDPDTEAGTLYRVTFRDARGRLYSCETNEPPPVNAKFGAYAGVTVLPLETLQRLTDPVPHVVEALKPYANGIANVKIVFWSNAHRGLADRVRSAFELAGWKVNYTSVAQELHNPHRFDGIEVSGFNSQLVNIGAEAVTALGGWEVRKRLDDLRVDPQNPKYPSSQQSIRITIGYPKS